MRRRIFVTSGLGLLAAAASQGLVGIFTGAGLRAQPAAASAPPPQGKWIRLAPLPQATGELLGVAINGKVYAAQGLLPGFKPAGLVYEYDPAREPKRSIGTVEEYDPTTNTWRARASMPTPCNHMGGEAVNGKIYVIGGRLSGAFIIGFPGNINLVQAYDPAADSWVTKTPMPTPRSGFNTAALNGIIYAAGGEVQNGSYLAAFRAFEAYDPASDTWWQLPSMLLPRHEAIMAVLGNRIHVAGGSLPSRAGPPPQGPSFGTAAHQAFWGAPLK